MGRYPSSTDSPGKTESPPNDTLTSTDTFNTFTSPISSTDTFNSLLCSLTWYTALDITSVGPTAVNETALVDTELIGAAYC